MGQLWGKKFDIPDFAVTLFFETLCHMQINFPRNFAVVMAETRRDRVNINALLHHEGGVGMPERVGRDPAAEDPLRILPEILCIRIKRYMPKVFMWEKQVFRIHSDNVMAYIARNKKLPAEVI